ncbi:MAG: tetratricopeptide repeat protein [Nitrospira sp.]|nr:tetratricopeptide repeat protein [Nitrospira sp.]
MTYRIKVPPRSLPVDEAHLVSTLEHRLFSLREYRWPLLVGFALLLLVGAGVWAVLWYDTQNASKAGDIEREATRHYLTRPANDPQKTELNLKEAIVLYTKIVDEYPRTPSAPLALFSLGNALMETNQLDSAIAAYTRFLSNYGSNAPLAGLVQQKLAYAYLSKGDRAQAAKTYSAIVDSPGSINRDQAMFELARLEESQSQLDGALKRYQDLMKTYPNSPFASEAAIREKIFDARKAHETAPTATTSPSAESKIPANP